MRRTLLVLNFAAWVVSIALGAQQPTFRADVFAVAADVSVRQGNRPVAGLTAGAFTIRDNGRPQVVVDVSQDSLPLDVFLIVDASASAQVPNLRDRIAVLASEVPALLPPRDQLHVLEFGGTVRRRSSLRPEGWPVEERQTALFDSLLVALMQPTRHDRRQIVVILTDGFDMASQVPASLRTMVLDRASAPVYLWLLDDGRGAGRLAGPSSAGGEAGAARAFVANPMQAYGYWLQDATRRTGGQLFYLAEAAAFGTKLREVLGDYRQRYVVRFVPDDPTPGWHELDIQVRHSERVDVTHRRGYIRPKP